MLEQGIAPAATKTLYQGWLFAPALTGKHSSTLLCLLFFYDDPQTEVSLYDDRTTIDGPPPSFWPPISTVVSSRKPGRRNLGEQKGV